jgi:hypothetical protein
VAIGWKWNLYNNSKKEDNKEQKKRQESNVLPAMRSNLGATRTLSSVAIGWKWKLSVQQIALALSPTGRLTTSTCRIFMTSFRV